ncbi:MAG: hypothetical protein JWM68_3606 [Verrucomicrobiales bacterium]|nr:hypothetical protein [Verrucomicrobiales bacterium]
MRDYSKNCQILRKAENASISILVFPAKPDKSPVKIAQNTAIPLLFSINKPENRLIHRFSAVGNPSNSMLC